MYVYTFTFTYPIAFGCHRGAVDFLIIFLHPSLFFVLNMVSPTTDPFQYIILPLHIGHPFPSFTNNSTLENCFRYSIISYYMTKLFNFFVMTISSNSE